jgi:hypothetical protein
MSYAGQIAVANGGIQITAAGAKTFDRPVKSFVSNDAIISAITGKQNTQDTAVSIIAKLTDDASKSFVNGIPITPPDGYYIVSITLVSGSYYAVY